MASRPTSRQRRSHRPQQAGAAPLGTRTDLRNIPLVTIDGEDARDFDDAVWATADTDPTIPAAGSCWSPSPMSPGMCAQDDALDKSARERGNSVYFPDRVVPMLPEELSNGWCSLRPDEDRPVMAVEIVIDAEGNKQRHHFLRGLMRSAARLTYERAQAAMDGRTDAGTAAAARAGDQAALRRLPRAAEGPRGARHAGARSAGAPGRHRRERRDPERSKRASASTPIA